MACFVDRLGGDFAAARILDQGLHGVDHFGASAVVDRQVHLQARGSPRGFGQHIEQLGAHLRRQRIQAADGVQADLLAHHLGQFEAQVSAQQAPQHFDFGARTLPVLDRKGVQRERLDAHLRAGFDHGAHRTHAGLVSGDAQQAAAAGPAPVAVHDDGDVRGQALGIDRSRQRLIRVTCRRARTMPA